MALTRLDFTSDGATTVHDVSFSLGYLRTDDVYVYLDPDDYTTQLAYTWVSTTQIQLTTPVTAGLVYHIRRVVQRDSPVNDYEDGAILRKKNLNNSFAQSLMILEEIADGYANPDGTFIVEGDVQVNGNSALDGDLDMLGHTIKNIADPTNSQDATSKVYVDTQDTNTLILANDYTNTKVADYTYTKAVIDSKDAAVGVAANIYTDQQVSNSQLASTGVVGVETSRQIGDGNAVTFATAAVGADSTSNFNVFLDGVRQKPTLDYTVNSVGQIVFYVAPEVNVLIDIQYFKPLIYELENVDAVIPLQAPRYVGDASTVLFQSPIITYGTETSFFVHIDGIAQRPYVDFTCNNLGQVVFLVAPELGTLIDITYFNPQPKDVVETTSPILMVNKYITADATIADPYNALSVSPTITAGVVVTVNEGAEYVVL